jgi:hypothetical protein
MPFGGALTVALVSGGFGLAGSLANKGQQASTPTLDPAYSPLQQALLPIVQRRLAGGGLPPGFESSGVSAINSTFGASDRAANQDLVRRGLARSPVAATGATTRREARTGAIASFRAGLPLIAQDLESQNIEQANRILNQGRGVTTTTEGGGGAAGFATNAASMLGYLYGKGKFGGGGGGGGYTGGGYTPYDGAAFDDSSVL